ncbi:MAG: anti-sigma factor [Chloroflexota bacterium]
MDNTNVPEESWESRLIDYTLGVMEPGEAEKFALSLAECQQHVQLARQYEQTMGWIGAAAKEAEPPAGHQARLMAQVAAAPQGKAVAPPMPILIPPTETTARQERAQVPSPTPPAVLPVESAGAQPKVVDLAAYRERRRNLFLGVMGAIAAALILVVGLSSLLGQNSKLIIPAGYQVVQLAPEPGYNTASAVVLYDPTKNEATLLGTGFPQVPAGKVYELWVLPAKANEAPDQAGTFVPDTSGASQHFAQAPRSVGTYVGFAVTLEDAPGVPVAKGPVVVKGTFPTHE